MLKSFTRLLFTLGSLALSMTAQANVQIFACEPEWATLAKELAGDRANTFAATHAGQDPHHIQARPSLIAKLRSSDLAICTGAGLETGWMPMLQRRARNPKVMPGEPGYLEAAGQVERLEIPAALDRAEGDVHGDGNPHVQLDPRRVLEIAKALSSRLQTIDPANKAHYLQRAEAFSRRWLAAIQRWEAQAHALKGKRVIVHHREWTYLLDWLGMQRVGSLEPKPGIPPTLSHLADLKELQADRIIVSPLNDDKPSTWLHEQTGTDVVVLPQTVGAVKGTEDLFGLFDEIIRRLTTGDGA